MSDDSDKKDRQDEQEFLLFAVGQIMFGTPLLGVREIVKPQSYKHVPNTSDHFLGVINLRGQIVGVVDFRKKLNLEVTNSEGEALLVFETEAGTLSALVDDVIAVKKITSESIDLNPTVVSSIPLEFLIGIGKVDNEIVNIIDLNKVLGNEEILKFSELVA